MSNFSLNYKRKQMKKVKRADPMDNKKTSKRDRNTVTVAQNSFLIFVILIFWWIDTATIFLLYPSKLYQTNAQSLLKKLSSFFRHKRFP